MPRCCPVSLWMLRSHAAPRSRSSPQQRFFLAAFSDSASHTLSMPSISPPEDHHPISRVLLNRPDPSLNPVNRDLAGFLRERAQVHHDGLMTILCSVSSTASTRSGCRVVITGMSDCVSNLMFLHELRQTGKLLGSSDGSTGQGPDGQGFWLERT